MGACAPGSLLAGVYGSAVRFLASTLAKSPAPTLQSPATPLPTPPTVKTSNRPAPNPANPLAQHLDAILVEDRARWLYERARLRRDTGLSKSHFARIVDGHGCSLDVALQLHTLTEGAVDPRGMTPSTPWDRLDAYYRRS